MRDDVDGGHDFSRTSAVGFAYTPPLTPWSAVSSSAKAAAPWIRDRRTDRANQRRPTRHQSRDAVPCALEASAAGVAVAGHALRAQDAPQDAAVRGDGRSDHGTRPRAVGLRLHHSQRLPPQAHRPAQPACCTRSVGTPRPRAASGSAWRTMQRLGRTLMVYAENQIPSEIDSARLANDSQTAGGRQQQASLARDEHG